MLTAIIALSVICLALIVAVSLYVWNTERVIDRMRIDMMDRFMEENLTRLKRAQSITIRSNGNHEPEEPQVDDDEEEWDNKMGARL